jgi:Flp pilus assembly protein TadG
MDDACNLHHARDRGVVTPVEMMFVLVFVVLSVAFLGFLGRLHAAGVQVANTSQSAARAASLAGDALDARSVAQEVVSGSTLSTRCRTAPVAELSWQPSATGDWQGGQVTVTVSCVVANVDLSGIWSPGSRTLRASDTQPIDRYQR